ncbi:MAG: outer membrane beta-barrel protein [Hyphomicrobiaceae bacterium]
MKLTVHGSWSAACAAALIMAMSALVACDARAQGAEGPNLGPWPTIARIAQPMMRPPVAPPFGTRVSAPVAPIRSIDSEADNDDAQSTASAEPDALTEPVAPVDGLLEPAEPQSVIDGVDLDADTRSEDDRQAFVPNEPPAGYDPSQFTIEIEPLLDHRPARFADLDPYAPTGIRLGSFVLYPEAEIGVTAFNNVLRTSTNRQSDVALEVQPAARLISTWNVHALELGARGLTSFHDELPSEDDRAWALDARGRLDVTRRTNLEGSLGHEVTQESRGTINSRATPGGRSDVTTDRAAVAFNHRFNRLRVQLRGAVAERDYSPEIESDGTLLSNDDRDSRQHEVAVRATWEFKPAFSVFGEVGTDGRDYRLASFSDGLRRDSSGERYRAGVSLGNAGEIIRGEAAVGYLEQRFEDGHLPSVAGMILDANLGWRMTGLTSLILTARTDLGESTVAGSGGSLAQSAGAEVRHAFRRNVVGSAGVRMTRAKYAGVDLIEQDVTTSLGVDYFLSREVSLFGRYAHIDYSSTGPGNDYAADEVRFGVRVRR